MFLASFDGLEPPRPSFDGGDASAKSPNRSSEVRHSSSSFTDSRHRKAKVSPMIANRKKERRIDAVFIVFCCCCCCCCSCSLRMECFEIVSTHQAS